MKRIYLLLITSLLILSCSDDTEINQHAANKSNEVLQKSISSLELAYNEYLTSPSYSVYINSLEDFMGQFYTNELPDVFYDEDVMFNWISQNLSSTNFTTLGHAKEDWQSVVGNAKTALLSNPTFYDERNKNLSGFIHLITPPPPTATQNCQYQCSLANGACKMKAVKAFETGCENVNKEGLPIVAASEKIAKLEATFNSSLLKCEDTYRKCIMPCN